MPRVTDAYRAERRSQIIEAAFACFAARGFHATTMDDICAAVGLSPGAVYRYFRSKDDIIETTIRQGQVEDVRQMTEVAAGKPAREAIESVLANAFAYLREESQARASVVLETWAGGARNEQLGEAMRATVDALIGTATSILEAGKAAGELEPGLDSEAVAEVLLALFSGRRFVQGVGRGVPMDRYLAAVRQVVSALAGPPGAAPRADGGGGAA
jgi:AcrR family transcriptional regulator